MKLLKIALGSMLTMVSISALAVDLPSESSVPSCVNSVITDQLSTSRCTFSNLSDKPNTFFYCGFVDQSGHRYDNGFIRGDNRNVLISGFKPDHPNAGQLWTGALSINDYFFVAEKDSSATQQPVVDFQAISPKHGIHIQCIGTATQPKGRKQFPGQPGQQ